MEARDLIFVTSGYKVIALKKSDGSQIWERTLVNKFFKPGFPFVTMIVDETGVYVHTISEMFRLDLNSGGIVWKTELAPDSWTRMSQIASLAMLGESSSPAGPAARAADDRRRSD
jgi:outer membrane protein assembly factor BamB